MTRSQRISKYIWSISVMICFITTVTLAFNENIWHVMGIPFTISLFLALILPKYFDKSEICPTCNRRID